MSWGAEESYEGLVPHMPADIPCHDNKIGSFTIYTRRQIAQGVTSNHQQYVLVEPMTYVADDLFIKYLKEA